MKNNKLNRFLIKHITILVNVTYYFPIFAIFWNNGFGIIIGFLNKIICLHIKKEWKQGKGICFIKKTIKNIEFSFSLDGINLLPTITKRSFGFLFFSIQKNKQSHTGV
jgi:hypothetical protein